MLKSRKKIISLILAASVLISNIAILDTKANTFNEDKIEYATSQDIIEMTPTTDTTIKVDASGGCGFTFPTFNNGIASFDDVKNDILLFVEKNGEWISIDNNIESGWIYNVNFGHFWDGPGGFWFNPVEETTKVKIESKSNSNIFIEYTLQVDSPSRNSYKITTFDGRDIFEADEVGSIGIPLPKIDGGTATKKEIDNFVYEVKVGDEWVNILESDITGFKYSSNGYDKLSSANQWGYWIDGIFGLWFQPIQKDVEFRIGYPLDGERGGEIKDNYVTYKFIGNPNAPRPDVSALGNIEIGTSEDPTIEGWELVWNDEFTGNKLDESKWNYELGYYIDEDPDKWGWGNGELQHYTNSEENVFVKDGNLNIVALEDPKSFPQNPDRIAPYSSGKITTKDKYKFTYGRIDFSVKLPVGQGAWPALWMLPNDNVYGDWALSGEIDVMEARGRVPGETSGALHFGGQWPLNTHVSAVQTFPDGGRFDDGFHTYSLIWEQDTIKWYVDGRCFYIVSKEEWYSLAAGDNENAPFDQDFYIVMNLAMGGWFDGGVEPTPDMFPATMQVDYVRVYNEVNEEDNEAKDKEAAEIVITKINEIPSEVTLEDKGIINEARTAYNALTEAQKALVSKEILAKLVAAEAKITELEKENNNSNVTVKPDKDNNNNNNNSNNNSNQNKLPQTGGVNTIYVLLFGITLLISGVILRKKNKKTV